MFPAHSASTPGPSQAKTDRGTAGKPLAHVRVPQSPAVPYDLRFDGIRMTDEEPPGETLRELIERAKAEDREALAKLIELHEPMLLRWARQRLGYPLRTLQDTRDVIHDTYAVVLKKIDHFEYHDPRSFARWLRGIVTRIVLQKAGGVDLRRRLKLPDEPALPDLSATPSTTATFREIRQERYRVLREFDRTDRLIYRLRMRGFSSTQIADYVGMTDRGVRLRFAKTDAKIRMRMLKIVDPRRRDDDE